MGAMLAGLTACDGALEFPTEGGEGQLDLTSLSITNDDAAKIVKTEQASRADGDTDLSAYTVKIYKDGEESAYRTYTYAEMPEVISLPAGSYTAEAYSHEVKKAAWEEPYFYGKSEAFNIEAGKITNGVAIECKFASIAVSIYFADDIKALMGNDVKVNVLVNDKGSLDYTATETRTGHFEALPESNTMAVTFTGTVDGVYTTATKTFPDLAPQQHRKITFKTKNNPEIPEQSGSIDPTQGIQVDFSVIDEDVDGNVTVVEDGLDASDRPGKEDPIENPDKPDEPVGEVDIDFGGTLNDGATYTTKELSAYTVVINATKGIKDLVVKISSTDGLTKDTLVGVGLTDEFSLVTSDQYAEALVGLGFPFGEDVKDKTELTIDITGFMALLEALGKNTDVFTMTVTDSENSVKSLSFTIVAQP